MKKIIIFCLFFISYINIHAQNANVKGIITDFNGFDISTSNATEAIPISRNLLAFSTDSKKYFTTGVDKDSILTSRNLPECEDLSANNTICIVKQFFKSFPAKPLPNLINNNISGQNLIGLPKAYEPIAATYPNDYKYYLNDGKNGLDISTAFFNINLLGGKISFDGVAITESSIGDNIPDIIVTQTGVPETNLAKLDQYYFEGYTATSPKNLQLIGNKYQVNFNNSVDPVGKTRYVFYNYDYTLANDPNAKINVSKRHNASDDSGGNRDLRILAFDWSDFGINSSNYKNVYSFNQLFNGASDVAFIAYNETSLIFVRNISGNIKQVELDGITKNPFNPLYIKMELYLVKNGIMEATPISSVNIDTDGNYIFRNILSNLPEENYRIVANINNSITPKNFFIVENVDNTLNNYVELNLGYDNIVDRNFVLANFCLKAPKITETIRTSTPIGISTLNKQADGWPNAIPNAHLVLESREKGFVITSTTSNSLDTSNLKEGMIIYDTTDKCIKLYDGNEWFCIQRECNEE